MNRLLSTICFAVALWGIGTACTPTVDCEDLGCAFGLVCDVESGECLPEVQDCREAPEICSRSEVCDEQTGDCRPSVTQCADSGACPTGQVCDAQSGTCRAATRCTIDGCEAQEVCNEATDRCEPRPCLEDLDCPTASGFICGDTNVCVRGCRPGSSQCPADQTCVTESGASTGICQDRCVEDTDCAFGQVCVDDGNRSQCEAEPPCSADADCRADEVCIASNCSQPRCTTDDDCEAGQVCQVASGLCFGGNCSEDQFGNGESRPPNHSFDAAFPLTDSEPSLTGLTLCPGRSDWFRIEVRTTELIVATVNQLEPGAALDLYVWDANRTLVAADTGVRSNSSVRFDGRKDQVVYIEIRPSSERTITYDLSIGRDFCAVDTFEENDSYTRATTIPVAADAPVLLSLTACGFDQDWFRLPSIAASSGLRAEIRLGSSDLRGVVLTPDGETFPFRRDDRFDVLRAGEPGDYYIRIMPSLGLQSEYELLVESRSRATCSSANENTTLEDAATLAADAPTEFEYCPASATGWEIDWIELTDAIDGIVDITLDASVDAPPVDMTLVRVRNGVPTDVKTVSSQGERARLISGVSGEANDDYFVRITSSAALGRIKEFPTYRISYSVSTP